MTDWFDIFMRILTCIALFMAGYNIGWSRGYEKCRSMVEDAIADIKKALDTAKSVKNGTDKEV